MVWPARLRHGWVTAIALMAILAIAPAAADATTFDVSSTADTNTPGTLRNAINQANLDLDPVSAITFNGLATGTQTIALSSALPAIAHATTVDATGHESAPGAPNVVISGSGITAPGLDVQAAGSAITGLSIVNFGVSPGIEVERNNVTVSGNYLGLDATGAAHGNFVGVTVAGGASASLTGIVLGGTSSAARNVIGGNGTGIAISNADGTTIQGNYVGLDPAGTAARPNLTGIDLFQGFGTPLTVNGTVIGGHTAGERNVIAGNTADGIDLDDATVSDTQITGNRVGTTADGAHALPNHNGITLQGETTGNHIGDGQTGGGNLISGNAQAGVLVFGSTDDTHFAGNFIGTDQNGTGSIPNGTGIHVGANAGNTLIGSLFAGTKNIVAGNSGAGILIDGAASNTSVKGNYIGLDVIGIRDPNHDGIDLFGGGVGNLIGGSAVGEGNFISGNNGDGIDVTCQFALVAGNTIGLDPSNDQPRGNGLAGVRVGGPLITVSNNLISSNEQHGVALVGGSQAHVTRNHIGTNLGGDGARPNGGAGINISGGSLAVIGGTAPTDGNLISGNTLFGIEIDGPSNLNSIFGNLIGTDASGTAPLGSRQPIGIGIDASHGPVTKTTIGGLAPGQPNTIAFNGRNIAFEVPLFESTGTAIRENSIFGSTTGMGIDLLNDGVPTPNDLGDPDAGANLMQNFPVLTSAVTSGGKTVIDGTLTSTHDTSYAIDLYSNPSCSKTGNGEAQTYLGTITPVDTDSNGNAAFQVTLAAPVQAGQVVTAIATDPDGNSSEISACRTVTVPTSAVVTSPGPSTAVPLPPIGGPPIQIFTLPVAKLKLPKKQHLLKDKGIVLTLGSNVDADYSVAGVVSLPKLTAKAVKLKSAKGKLRAGKTTKVKLRASKALLKAARKAFAAHKKLTATVTIVLKGAGGTAKPVKRKVKLSP